MTIADRLAALDRDALVAFVAQIVGPQDAEDLVQDVYVKLLGDHRAFRGDASFKTWVFSVAKRMAIDTQRRARTRATFCEMPQALSLSGLDAADTHPSRLAPPASTLTPEDMTTILSGLGKLSPQSFKAMDVFLSSGGDYAEVAEALAITVPQARGLIARVQGHFQKWRDRR